MRSFFYLATLLTHLQNGTDENEIPELSIELSLLDKLKARVQLARQIDQSQHKVKKANYEKNWLKETAETLGVELDSDFMRFVHSPPFLTPHRPFL